MIRWTNKGMLLIRYVTSSHLDTAFAEHTQDSFKHLTLNEELSSEIAYAQSAPIKATNKLKCEEEEQISEDIWPNALRSSQYYCFMKHCRAGITHSMNRKRDPKACGKFSESTITYGSSTSERPLKYYVTCKHYSSIALRVATEKILSTSL
uniref:Ovule protein n=1 Tax=Heterorhabditis bacteriophora TaxID=37862 RepID=A0A1I7WP12_HETBA